MRGAALTILVVALMSGASLTALADDVAPADQLKSDGRAIGQGTRDAAVDVGHGVRDSAVQVGHGFSNAAHAIGDGFDSAWNSFVGRPQPRRPEPLPASHPPATPDNSIQSEPLSPPDKAP